MRTKNRTKALEMGLKFYYSNSVCKRGHSGKRYTSSGGCIECNTVCMDKPSLTRSREEALRNGDKFYASIVQCKHGHLGKRRVDTDACVLCISLWDKQYRDNFV